MLTIRRKLFILTAVPLLFATALGAMFIYQSYSDLSKIRDAARRLEAMNLLSEILNEVQTERGLSSLFLNGGASSVLLTAQRSTFDAAYSKNIDRLNVLVFSDQARKTLQDLSGTIISLRKKVDEREMLESTSFSTYTSLVQNLQGLIQQASRTDSPEVMDYLFNILLFEEAKEGAGRARGQMGAIFALDLPMQETAVLNLVNAAVSIGLNLDSKGLELTPELAAQLETLKKSSSWRTLNEALLNILAKSTEGAYGWNSSGFFTTATGVVDGIREIIALASQQTSEIIDTRAMQLFNEILIAGIIVGSLVILFTILSVAIMSNISRSIRLIAAGMKEISGGDADLTRSLNVHSKDELGQLGGHFNSFTGRLRELIQNIKDEVHALEKNVLDLSANTNETASAVAQITANIDSLKLQTINQSASVTESSATIEQIARNIERLYKLIERQAEGVSTSSSSIEEMVANIQSVTTNIERMGSYYEALLGKSDSGRNAIATVVSQVKEIDQQSELLQEANSLIAGIAAQTNLLAMNAAIEAAHAGEAGSGFAVVADEIRKLAENAARQSKTITQNIKATKSVVAAVVNSSSTAEKNFEEIVEQIRILSRLEEEVKYAMQEQSSGSAQILDSLSSINDVTYDVRVAAQEMKDGSVTVLTEMRHLLQLASELENGMNEMASGADEIRRAANDTNELGNSASRSVKHLAEETDQFHT
ncbi:MAG: nitrate- and nitrite sensing domain-containing protein [Spirochaetes bacterium]|nr:nitrate- and nitrite sensing domain-containing protein [Spirochaetota bacterium]